MARITAPGGRVVLTFVNYGGVTVRASRVLYRVGRRLGLLTAPSEREQFWDTPVAYEHNFECTLENVSAMCQAYLELEHAWGISLGCRFPGWSRLLERVPALRGRFPCSIVSSPGVHAPPTTWSRCGDRSHARSGPRRTSCACARRIPSISG
jgi:hypothetical protein